MYAAAASFTTAALYAACAFFPPSASLACVLSCVSVLYAAALCAESFRFFAIAIAFCAAPGVYLRASHAARPASTGPSETTAAERDLAICMRAVQCAAMERGRCDEQMHFVLHPRIFDRVDPGVAHTYDELVRQIGCYKVGAEAVQRIELGDGIIAAAVRTVLESIVAHRAPRDDGTAYDALLPEGHVRELLRACEHASARILSYA